MPQRRFSAIPIIAGILKVVSVLILLSLIYQASNAIGETIKTWAGAAGSMYQHSSGPVVGLIPRLKTLLPLLGSIGIQLFISMLSWAFGELILAIREIEFNTRRPEDFVEAPASLNEPAPAPKESAE